MKPIVSARRDRLLDDLRNIDDTITRIKRTLADLEQRKAEIETQLREDQPHVRR